MLVLTIVTSEYTYIDQSCYIPAKDSGRQFTLRTVYASLYTENRVVHRPTDTDARVRRPSSVYLHKQKRAGALFAVQGRPALHRTRTCSARCDWPGSRGDATSLFITDIAGQKTASIDQACIVYSRACLRSPVNDTEK